MKIKINGKFIDFFDKVVIQLNLDSVASVFSFVGRYNPENELHREVFRPLSYPKVEIFNENEEKILTGKIVNHSFNSDQTPGLWNLSGYSLPGVLENSNIPVSQYPLQSVKLNLQEITEKIIKPFGINLVIDPSVYRDTQINFKQSTALPEEPIKSYISKLAAQRNIVTSHDQDGNLKFFRPNIKMKPKQRFNKDNTLQMSLSVNAQQIHSIISVLRQPNEELENIPWYETIKNEVSDFLGFGEEEKQKTSPNYEVYNNKSQVVKNFSSKISILTSGSNTDYDISQAVKNQLSAELGNIKLTMVLPKIYDLMPGDIVEVKNNEVYLYEYTRLIIHSITTERTTKRENTKISLSIPESFTGEQPSKIFNYKNN